MIKDNVSDKIISGYKYELLLIYYLIGILFKISSLSILGTLQKYVIHIHKL